VKSSRLLLSLEAKPTSAGRQATLEEEVAATNLSQDKENRPGATALVGMIQNTPVGKQGCDTDGNG